MSMLRSTKSLLACAAAVALGGLSLPAALTAQETGRAAPQEPARTARQDRERETVRERLQTMRLAVKAFVEAERKDLAELVERAMHARELMLKGVRTEEARRIIAGAPSARRLARLMNAASELYEKWEMPDRAEALVRLAEVFGQQARRQQAAAQERAAPPAAQRPGQGPAGLDALERRVRILELARRAFDEAGRERAEAALARAVRYGKAMLAGDEAAMAATAEGVPEIAELIELLRGAGALLAKAGAEERATYCRQLARYYAAREGGAGAAVAPEREAPRWGDLDELENRIEILRLVKAAHVESGNRENAELMERILHLAELQLEGAGAEALAEAAEGLSQQMIVDLVAKAVGLYAEWGNRERAVACRRLEAFYRGRDAAAGGGAARDPAPAEPAVEVDREVVLQKLRERIDRLEQELREVRQMLERLRR